MQGGLAAYLHANMKTILSAIACCLALATTALAGDTKITHADGKEAVKLVAEKKVAVVDVRTPAEFGLAHIDGSKNIDFKGADFEQELDKLDKKQPVLVHCAAGGRSTKSLATFKKLGFEQVIHLDGGFTAYEEAKAR